MPPTKNLLPDRQTLAFREGVFKSKLIGPVKLRVIQLVFAGEMMSVLQPCLMAKLRSGGG